MGSNVDLDMRRTDARWQPTIATPLAPVANDSRRDYDFHGPLARMMRLGNNFCHLVDLFHDSASTIRGRVLASLRGPV
ncbi:hypothetical protein J6590_067219 [Homalodisca vitripennis]|nr:hypothetical protein J6590_067219 [Homalodisca vitripennis]